MDENVKNDAKQVMLVQNADDGRLQACLLYTSPYFQNAPAGKYETEICVIKSDDEDCDRYAAVRLRFNEKRACLLYTSHERGAAFQVRVDVAEDQLPFTPDVYKRQVSRFSFPTNAS